MYKLLIFACILAVAVAAPKPQVFFSPYSASYTATAPITYSTYSAPFTYLFSAPFTYAATQASAYSVYPYSAYSSPYTIYYK